MQRGRAFLAGVAGAAVVTLLELVARAGGVPANLEMLVGTGRWLAGLVVHLAGGGGLALGYAAVFESRGRAGWTAGVALGALQALGVGGLLGVLPRVHPLVPEILPAPGAFMSNFGSAGVALHVAGHLLFGALVGATYESAMAQRRARDAARRGRRRAVPPGGLTPPPGRQACRRSSQTRNAPSTTTSGTMTSQWLMPSRPGSVSLP